MATLFSNNASATLALNVGVTDGTITLAAGEGAKFPNPGAADQFYVTLEDLSSGATEIMICDSRTGDVLTVQRGQEGTAIGTFNVADTIVQNRLTAASLNGLGGGTGLPSGGAENAMLRKFSAADGDAFWVLDIKPESVSAQKTGSGVDRPHVTIWDKSVAAPHAGFVLEDYAEEFRFSYEASGSKTTGFDFDKTAFDFKFPVSVNGDVVWDAGSFDPTSKEDALGNPGTDGYVLASTIAGVRSWVSLTGGGNVPVGGATNAILRKLSASDGDTGWTNDPTFKSLQIEDDISDPFLELQSTNGTINPATHLGYRQKDSSGTFILERKDSGGDVILLTYGVASNRFEFQNIAGITINGFNVITSDDGVLLDTDSPTLTGIWDFQEDVRIANGKYFQADVNAGTPENVVGITAADVVEVGAADYQLQLMSDVTPLLYLGDTAETVNIIHSGIFSPSDKEDYLDVPAADGYVLSSLTNGTRSWVANVPFDAAADYQVTGFWEFYQPVDIVIDSASEKNGLSITDDVGTRFAISVPPGATEDRDTVFKNYLNDLSDDVEVFRMRQLTTDVAFKNRIAVEDEAGDAVTQPRIFVQATDPGTDAADGDLWIW